MVLLLNDVEKVWIIRELDSGSLYSHLPLRRDDLKKLWNSEMGQDDYAEFVESLPIF